MERLKIYSNAACYRCGSMGAVRVRNWVFYCPSCLDEKEKEKNDNLTKGMDGTGNV